MIFIVHMNGICFCYGFLMNTPVKRSFLFLFFTSPLSFPSYYTLHLQSPHCNYSLFPSVLQGPHPALNEPLEPLVSSALRLGGLQMCNYTFSHSLHARADVDLLHCAWRLKQEGSIGVNLAVFPFLALCQSFTLMGHFKQI